jgi:hypothetical protein
MSNKLQESISEGKKKWFQSKHKSKKKHVRETWGSLWSGMMEIKT